MKFFKQLGLLLWKNFLNQKRQVVWTILELVIPLTFTAVFVGMRQIVDSKWMGTTKYEPYHVTGTWLDFWQKIDSASMINHSMVALGKIKKNFCVPFNPKLVYYAPDTTLTRSVMEIVSARMDLDIKGYSDEDAMVNEIVTVFDKVSKCDNPLLGGISFDPNSFGNSNFTNNTLAYSIRLSNTMRNQNRNKTQQTKMVNVNKGWNTNLDYPVMPMLGPREPNSTDGGKPGYWRETFLTLQKAVDAAVTTIVQYSLNPNIWPITHCNVSQKEVVLYIYCKHHPNASFPGLQDLCKQMEEDVAPFLENITQECMQALESNAGLLTSVMLQRFPYPPYLNNPYIAVIQQNLPILIMLSYVISALYIIRYVTIEKEKRLKEYMRVMGLSNLVQWTSYFIINMLKLLVSVLFMSITLVVPINGKSVMDKSDPTVLFVFLFVYSICTVCYCFAISVFFKRGNTAAAFGGIIWFIGYVPYFFLQPRYGTLKRSTKFASSLLFSTAMSYGAQIIGSFEGQNEGINWRNINKPATIDDNITMVDVIMMMLVDAVICLLITWYVEAVHPGDEGVPQPFYFPFTISYWCPRKVCPGRVQLIDYNVTVDELTSNKIEPYPDEVPQVVVHKLTKVFGRKMKRKVAVNELCLRMYAGQTTVLLGHNGAGKSTTMAMLTGMMAPTSGNATLNGFDIHDGLSSARQYLGLCPQYNPLFDNMTVFEHVKFFCKLKGRPLNLQEIQQLFHSLGLEPKVNCLAKNLSGGMKRKLCLAIALVGGSEIVMLDEPTSGMDPSARHEAWHLLQQEKRRRTILLTTHYMEEADLLGDRIAILSHGKLQCFGSSLFLKHIYGAGYHLTVIFDKVEDEIHDIKERAEIVVEMIREQVPDAQIESAVGAEASFLLPTDYRDRYQTLFCNLEASQQNLAVLSFGVSVTTMEEVFLRVGKEADEKHYHRAESNQPIVNVKDLSFGSNKHVEGFCLNLQQFKALIIKRALHSLRNWLVLIAQLIVPVGLLVVSVLVNMMLPGPAVEPPLSLNLNHFGNTTVGVANNGLNGSRAENLSVQYTRLLQAQGQQMTAIDNNTMNNYAEVNTRHIIAAVFDTVLIPLKDFTLQIPKLIAGFNNEPYHGPGITLNAIDNAILSEVSDGYYQLKTINHPLPPTNLDKLDDWISSGVMEFNIALFLMFGMSFLASSFVVLLIKERVTKAKHLQLLGGLPSSIFWLTSFLWDYLNYLLTVACLLIVLKAFSWSESGGTSVLVDDGRWAHTLLILVLYGWATFPMMYCFTFAFSSPASGFVMMTIFNILTGMALFAITSVFLLLKLYHVYKIIHFVFMVFFPTFCLGETIDLYYMNFFIRTSCTPYLKYCSIFGQSSNMTCCRPGIFTNNFLQWKAPGIGIWLCFMFLQGLGSFMILTFIETGGMRSIGYSIKRIFSRAKPKALMDAEATTVFADIDADVVQESETAATVSCDKVPVVARDLTKYYGSFLAVDKVNFVVQSGECFGLLGVNGAGKTTTFQMLTGENSLTDGDAFIAGNSIKHQWHQAGKMVGYCPQFDALIDQLTGREHLFMFARLKGIPEKQIKTISDNVIYAVGISEYADKQVKTYSGGNKRKLSLGIGLVGAPKVLLLDEPTSGVDPASRRVIWNVLAQVRATGVAVVLTSHSMEECEALCTRLAIMVDGKFKCLGSSQHLKTKRGKGYTLLIKLADVSHIEQAFKIMENNFPGCVLKEMHHCQLHYEVPVSEKQTWSSLFGTLERLVEPLHIVDYSLSQITLEQIFLSLLAEQNLGVLSTESSFTSQYD